MERAPFTHWSSELLSGARPQFREQLRDMLELVMETHPPRRPRSRHSRVTLASWLLLLWHGLMADLQEPARLIMLNAGLKSLLETPIDPAFLTDDEFVGAFQRIRFKARLAEFIHLLSACDPGVVRMQ